MHKIGFLKNIAMMLTICIVVGCTTFGPITSENIDYNLQIGQISFADKPNRSRLLFEKKIKQLFEAQNHSNKDQYLLNATITKSSISYGTQQDATNTRAILKFIASYNVIERNTGDVVAEGTAVVADSYEISTSLYSSTITEESVSDRLATALAYEIKNIVDSKLIKYTNDKIR